MKNIFKKFISIILSFVLLFSIFGFITKNIEYNTYSVNAAETSSGDIESKSAKKASKTENKSHKANIKDELKARQIENRNLSIASGLVNCVDLAYDIYMSIAMGETDYMGLIYGSTEVIGKFVMTYFGLGQIADQTFNVLNNVLLKGDQPLSEVQKLEDNMNYQFNQVKDELSDIHNEINELSLKFDDSTNKILNEITNSLNNLDAKQYVRTFMNSGEGNFSYTMFKNYLYGSTNNSNLFNKQAYYMSLVESIINNDSEKIVKEKYDELYNSINGLNNRNISNLQLLYEYTFGGSEPGSDKSIIQYYYDYLLANPSLVKETSPEIEAIMFAYDIYTTINKANLITQLCNNFQKMELLNDSINGNYKLDDNTRYYYSDYDYVTFKEINDNIDRMNILMEKHNYQIVIDLNYILNLKDSYIVEDNNRIYEIYNNNKGTYGNIYTNQTVYVNDIFDELISMFNINKDNLFITVNNETINNNYFIVDDSFSSITTRLLYKYNDTYNEIYSLDFNINNYDTFSGGEGTEEDPYLIKNKEQFALIDNDLDASYLLMNDIDFNSLELNPSGSIKDEFNGILNGNNYTIKNLIINSKGYESDKSEDVSMGLFSSISEKGSVCNIKFDSVNFIAKTAFDSIHAEKANGEINNMSFGLITGMNNGIISNITISDCNIEVVRTNENKNRQINLYVGGICGINNGLIEYTSIKSTNVIGESTHSFGNEEERNNENKVFVGGITGENYYLINNVSICNLSKVNAKAISFVNGAKKTIYPRVEAYSGGIIGKPLNNIFTAENINNYINNVYSNAITNSEFYIENKGTIGTSNDRYCKNVADKFIPEINTLKLDKIKSDNEEIGLIRDICDTITYVYNGELLYNVNDKLSLIEEDKLEIYSDNERLNFSIINKGFINSFNDQNEISNNLETLVLLIDYDNYSFYHILNIDIKVKPKEEVGIEISDYPKLNYDSIYDVVNLDNLSINLLYSDGSYSSVNLKDCEIIVPETLLHGENIITINYNNFSTELIINVKCDHNYKKIYADSGEEKYTIAPTCQKLGYDVFKCDQCGDIKIDNYKAPSDHNIIIINTIEATCIDDGHTGISLCKDCNLIFDEGKTLNKTRHNYVLKNNNHECINCNKIETHQYTVSESIINGFINYEYKCIECNYSYVHVDENIITEDINSLPQIIINKSYALLNDNKATVYVNLINNPGIRGANFGIRHDENIKLITITEGDLLRQSLAKDSFSVNCGYNFVWGNDSINYNNGNLLKLIFELPDDKKVNDVFSLNIVYGLINDTDGGFLTNKGIEKFIIKNNPIKIVDHLPGDINNDNVVDILDALHISSYLVGKTSIDNKQYADVNLDMKVDIEDLVILLQSINGSYDASLLDSSFDILFNTNGYDIEVENIDIDLYDKNNTYDFDYNLERPGYKFDGWYTRLYGGEKIEFGNTVSYQKDQVVQTLYAHWTLNEIIFNMNGSINDQVESIVYSEYNYDIDLESVEKKYIVNYFPNNPKFNITPETIEHIYKFVGWKYNNTLYNSFDLSTPNLGKILLVAEFNEPDFRYPNWQERGYESISWYGDSIYTPSKIIQNLSDLCNKATVVDGELDVYAKWNPIYYTIVFDNNNGIGTIDPIFGCNILKQVTLPSEGLRLDGYKLSGWAINDENSPLDGQELKLGSIISYIDGVKQNDQLILSAVWKPIDITININNYESNSIVAKYNDKLKNYLNLVTPTKEGYTFMGWYLDKNFNNAITINTFINYANGVNKTNNTIDVYAKWNANTYTVNYDPNGGEYIKSSETLEYNSPIHLQNPTKNYYKFIGWFDTNNIEYKDGTKMPSNDLTLQAKWELIISSETIVRIKNHDKITLNDGESYSDTIDISLNLNYLKEKGYKSISIKVLFNYKEVADCYLDFYVINNGNKVHDIEFDLNPNNENTIGYNQESYEFKISLSKLTFNSIDFKWHVVNNIFNADTIILGETSYSFEASFEPLDK